MASRDCNRETDILHAVGSGHIDDDLRSHIAACDACADLMAVASAVIDDRRALMREAPIPSSGLVWWRANLLARQEATRTAVRAATFVQMALIAAAIVVAVVAFGGSLPRVDLRPLLTIPIFAFLAWLILAPVAVYFAVIED